MTSEREEQYIHDNMVLEVEAEHLRMVNRQLGVFGMLRMAGISMASVEYFFR